MPDVTERNQNYFPVRMSGNFVYMIWAVFGGFILNFLLFNFLTVLLRPSYEKPVETAGDLLDRNITPFHNPVGKILTQMFANSPDPKYNEISRKLVIAKDWDEYKEMVGKVTSTGMFADLDIAPRPHIVPEEQHYKWYRSTEPVGVMNPYLLHLTTKKWPLKKVR